MSLEKFSRSQIPDRPAVAVRKNGSLSINNVATEQFELKEMRFVTLHFDREDKILGIRPEEDSTDSSVFMVSKQKDRTLVISCQAFLKHCGINYKEGSRILRAVWNSVEKMILVNLQTNHSGR